jgi:hypothetical protein
MVQTIQAMTRHVPGPWWLIAGRKEYLPACAEQGVLDRTVYLPYNVIEGEPSRPGTQLDFNLQRLHLDEAARYPGLGGLMGNVQTPLLQFPHVGFFLDVAGNIDHRKRTVRSVLNELADKVYPEHRDLLAACWTALQPNRREPATRLADRLERLLKEDRLGTPGSLGQRVFPDPRQIASDLVWQLGMWGTYDALCRTIRQRVSNTVCSRRLEAFLAAALDWDRQHGWSVYWKKLGCPWTLWPMHERSCQALVGGLRRMLGGKKVTPADVDAFLAPLGDRLRHQYDPWIVDRCALEPVKEAILKPVTP